MIATNKNKRVGIYLPHFRPSGPLRYVEAIEAAATDSEFELVRICDTTEAEGGSSLLSEVRRGSQGKSNIGIGVRPLLARTIPKALRTTAGIAKNIRALCRLYRSFDLDLMHTQNTGCEESPVAARLIGLPRILGTFHVDSTYDLTGAHSGPVHRTLEYWSNRCLHRAIAVSEATKRDWVRRTRLDPDRVTTIHNGIDVNHFSRCCEASAAREKLGLPPKPTIVIAAVGRLAPEKGFEYLLDAVAKVRSGFPDIAVAIAGTGPLREALEAQTARLNLGTVVRWLGFQDDVRTLLTAADIAVAPSLCETIGYAHMEAAAMELPIVATTVGGIPEVVVEGTTGFLVPPRNSDALAARLCTLLESQELRTRVGRAGRERISTHFRVEDMARRTIDVYREMLANDRGRR